MNKTELRHIAEDLVVELRELPDGTEITSGLLLKRIGYDPEELSEGELLGYHEALLRTAKTNPITLDMSKHENMSEGLLWNLDFVVRNKKAQIKCPRCGSIDTARIQYGMPAFTEELQEKMAAGKVFLGGCCIDGAYTEDGEWVSIDPTNHCNNCKKDFGGLQKKK